jgi:hypothetical protein
LSEAIIPTTFHHISRLPIVTEGLKSFLELLAKSLWMTIGSSKETP